MKYRYEIREKGTEFVAADDGGYYFDDTRTAHNEAIEYLTKYIIPDDYSGMNKTIEDFDIVIQEVNE